MAVITRLVLIVFLIEFVMALPELIRIGGLFDKDEGSLEVAFVSAVNRVNANRHILPKSRLVAQIENIGQYDSFEASKRVCSLMSTGVAAIFGPQSSETSAHVQSICDALEVPHIETRWDYRDRKDIYSVNLHPHPPTLSKAYDDLIQQFKWTSFAIVYEDNDGLVRLKDLFKTPPNGSPYKIFLRQLPSNGNYRRVLKEIKDQKYTKIVVDCKTSNLFQVLKQAQQMGLMTEEHHYVVTSMDLDTVDVEDFQYGGTSITALRLVNPKKTEVVKAVNEMKPAERHLPKNVGDRSDFSLRTETALVFDAVYLFAKALHDLDSSQHIDIKPLSCDSEDPWLPGNSLINYMKVVQLDGVSGIVGFDTSGFRTNFELDVVEVNEKGVKKIGSWSSRNKDKSHLGLNMTKRAISNNDEDAKPILKITTVLNEPYVMIKESKESLTGNNRFEGFCVDLMDEISSILKFRYAIYEVPDRSHGTRNPDTKEWNGLIREIRDKKADLAIGDITITSQREEVVDFTMPYMNLGISILYIKPTSAPPNILSFLSPFSMDVWLYMAITYLGVSLVLFLLARLSPYEWRSKGKVAAVGANPAKPGVVAKEVQLSENLHNQFGLLNSMWFTIGSLMQQGSDLAPKAASTRLVAGMWWFFTLIILSSYTANLAAFLAVEKSDSPIKNEKDLAKQSVIKYGLIGTGSTMAFFRDSKIQLYQDMWSNMISEKPSVFVTTNNVGVERVKEGNYALFMESASIDYMVERNCELARIGSLLDSKGYGFALPKGSSYRNDISATILQLQETGRLQVIKNKWWKQQRGGGKCIDEKQKVSGSAKKPLGLPHVGGVFLVLVSGMGLAFLVAFLEFFWKHRKEKSSLCGDCFMELSFALRCKKRRVRKSLKPIEPENGMAIPLPKYPIMEREMYS